MPWYLFVVMSQPRQETLARIQAVIESQSWPRIQMTLLVCLTGGIGFLTSFVLLHHGVTTIWVRYLISMGAAYIGFLFLLWIWSRARDRSLADNLDAPDIGWPGKGRSSQHCESEGGDVGGAGAHSAYHPETAVAESPNNGIADMVPDGLDLDELAIPVTAIVLAVVLVGSSFLIIVNAPALFAELLLDGILTASLYRRLRGLDQQHWLETALRRTAMPFATVTVILVAIGWTMQWLDPSISTVGEFLSHR